MSTHVVPIGASFMKSGSGDDNAALTEILNIPIPKLNGWYHVRLSLVSTNARRNLALRREITTGQDFIADYLVSSPSGVTHEFLWFGDCAAFSLTAVAAGGASVSNYYATATLTPIQAL